MKISTRTMALIAGLGFSGCMPGTAIIEGIQGEEATRADPPPLKWSARIVRKRRIKYGNQASQAGRDCHEVATG